LCAERRLGSGRPTRCSFHRPALGRRARSRLGTRSAPDLPADTRNHGALYLTLCAEPDPIRDPGARDGQQNLSERALGFVRLDEPEDLRSPGEGEQPRDTPRSLSLEALGTEQKGMHQTVHALFAWNDCAA